MDAENFTVINNNSQNPVFLYNINVKGEEEIYSPYGRSVIINTNYLLINPIKDISGELGIINKIINDENTLSILVPEQYKEFDKKITIAYKDWFYFYKVEVDNIYNKELGHPLNTQDKDELKINIIYTKKDQNYFTYDIYTGDKKSQIKDPIAIIYNEYLDTSCIGSYTTKSLFFVNTSKGKAFDEIKPLLIKMNMPEIDRVSSVYNEANNQLVLLKEKLFQQLISLSIFFVIFIVLFIIIVWSYYNSNLRELHLKYLLGYSNWEKNKSIIIPTILIYLLTIIIIILKFTIISIKIVPFIVLALIFDLCFIKKFGVFLISKDMYKLIKGDIL